MADYNLMPFQDYPFNGDTYVQSEFLKLKEEFNITTAIETGSCLFSTTKWLGENFRNVFTIEISNEFANYGRPKVSHLRNVISKIGESDIWLNELVTERLDKTDNCIFFLDAHWGNDCPLLRELDAIAFIKTDNPPIIVIHDFYTGNPDLGWDEYNGQPFTYDWIQPNINQLEKSLNCEYEHYFNTESVGAKRGVIFLKPKKATE